MLPLNDLVLIFCRILIDNVLELSKMRRATWKKILESEDDKEKIAEIFKRIDEHTKNFHVRSATLSQPIKILILCSLAETHVKH